MLSGDIALPALLLQLRHIFFGEEAAVAAILCKAGYNFFAPGLTVLWHNWKRAGRPSFREHQTSFSEVEAHASLERVRRLQAEALM